MLAAFALMARAMAMSAGAIAHYGLTAADLGFGKAARQVAKSPAAVGGTLLLDEALKLASPVQ